MISIVCGLIMDWDIRLLLTGEYDIVNDNGRRTGTYII